MPTTARGRDDDGPISDGVDPDVAAARAHYAVQRTLQRRPVRWALAGSQALTHGWRSGREMLGPAAELIDLPGPMASPRTRYPNLRVAHLGAVPLTDGIVPGERITPANWRTVLRRDRPDLVLLDDPRGWSTSELTELLAATPGAAIAPAGVHDQLHGSGTRTKGLMVLEEGRLPPYVDAWRCNPIGLPAFPPPDVVTSTGTLGPSGADHRPRTDDIEAAMVARKAATAVEPLAGSSDRTAHARRVLHLLAGGTPTVATETPLLRGLLPASTVDELLVPEAAGPAALMDRASRIAHDAGREAISVRSRRHVLAEHTRERAVDLLLEAAGLASVRPPLITVLLCTRRPKRVEEAIAAVARQTHPRLELVLVLHGINRPDDRVIGSSGVPTTVLGVGAERPLGAALDAGLDHARGDLIAKMDDDDLYGDRHLEDLVVALAYSGADAVGRWSHAVHLVDEDVTTYPHPDRQELWATHLPGATMLIRGEAMRAHRWRHVPNAVDTELVRAITAAGGMTYSTHRYGFVRRRHGDHTFRRRDRSFRGLESATDGLDRRMLDV